MILLVTLALLGMGATAFGQNEQKCRPGNCFGLDYNSLELKYYKGIFVTKDTIEERDRKWREKKMGMCHNMLPFYQAKSHRRERSTICPPNDHDRCCPTQRVHRKSRFLYNTNGEEKVILHFDFLDPPLYQWYPHAICGNSGSCSGTCRIEKITVYLLVYSFGGVWPFEFDSFEVNGYCSCKRN